MFDKSWKTIRQGNFGWVVTKNEGIMGFWCQEMSPEGSSNRLLPLLTAIRDWQNCGKIVVNNKTRSMLLEDKASIHKVSDELGGGYYVTIWAGSEIMEIGRQKSNQSAPVKFFKKIFDIKKILKDDPQYPSFKDQNKVLLICSGINLSNNDGDIDKDFAIMIMRNFIPNFNSVNNIEYIFDRSKNAIVANRNIIKIAESKKFDVFVLPEVQAITIKVAIGIALPYSEQRKPRAVLFTSEQVNDFTNLFEVKNQKIVLR